MIRRAIGFVSIATSVTIACSSFEEGTEAAPSTDAAPDDSGTGADGGSGPDGPSGDAGLHTFFDDFDQGPLGAKWLDKRIGAPATMELLGGETTSPPNALVVKYPDHLGGDFVYDAWLLHRFDKPTRSLTCRVMMFIEEPAKQSRPSVLNVKYRTTGTTEVDFNMNTESGSIAINQEGQQPEYPLAPFALGVGRWIPVAMSIDSDSGDISVRAGDMPYIDSKFKAPVRPNDGFEVRLGAFTVGPGDGATIRYDDFSCDVVFD